MPFLAFPTNRFSRFNPQPFRVLLLRRLHLPIPLSARRADVAVHSILATIGPREVHNWRGTPRTGADRTNGGGACICSTMKRAYSPKRETSWSQLPRTLGKLLSCLSLP